MAWTWFDDDRGFWAASGGADRWSGWCSRL